MAVGEIDATVDAIVTEHIKISDDIRHIDNVGWVIYFFPCNLDTFSSNVKNLSSNVKFFSQYFFQA